MTATIKKKIIPELNGFPEDKINSLLDYIHFLKKQKTEKKLTKKIKIPNKETIQTFKDTDNHKNLVTCKNADDMFRKLGI
ncbi:MAG: hypothetical protein PHH73_05055 [Candidatus Rickettsiella isopodorum]|nr:hypothetical protein [Candidatus Rickettsiella isopodorum]